MNLSADLILALVAVLSAVGGGVAWLVRQMVNMCKAMGKLETITESTNKQVTNTHTTNLREDITDIQKSLDSIHCELAGIKNDIVASKTDRESLHGKINRLNRTVYTNRKSR